MNSGLNCKRSIRYSCGDHLKNVSFLYKETNKIIVIYIKSIHFSCSFLPEQSDIVVFVDEWIELNLYFYPLDLVVLLVGGFESNMMESWLVRIMDQKIGLVLLQHYHLQDKIDFLDNMDPTNKQKNIFHKSIKMMVNKLYRLWFNLDFWEIHFNSHFSFESFIQGKSPWWRRIPSRNSTHHHHHHWIKILWE